MIATPLTLSPLRKMMTITSNSGSNIRSIKNIENSSKNSILVVFIAYRLYYS